MTYLFFLRIIQLKMLGFCLFKLPSSPCLVSQVITATMLFLQFVLYSSSFVGTLKNEIPEAALELCHMKIKQLSPEILKFRTKHKDNPFTLNCSVVSAAFCLYFMQAHVDWVLIILGTQVIKKKQPVQPVFPDYFFVSYDYNQSEPVFPSGFATSVLAVQSSAITLEQHCGELN